MCRKITNFVLCTTYIKFAKNGQNGPFLFILGQNYITTRIKLANLAKIFQPVQNPKTTSTLRSLNTRRYTTYGLTDVPAKAARQVDAVRVEAQAAGAGRRVGDRGPIVPGVARGVQVVSRADVARTDKEQRSSGNRISATTSKASKTVLIKEVIETTRNIVIISMA